MLAVRAEDDHRQLSRWWDLSLRQAIDVPSPRAVNRISRRIEDLAATGDEFAVRQHARVVVRDREWGARAGDQLAEVTRMASAATR